MAKVKNNNGAFKKGHQAAYKNGISKRPSYKTMLEVWTNMKNRCYREEDIGYSRYGERGIKVCDRWLTFTNFYEDMYPSYKKGLSIERIDNEGNYSRENCKWATWKEQCNNRRTNRVLSYKGQSKTLSEWAEEVGIKRGTISQRVDAYGWSVEKALSTGVLF